MTRFNLSATPAGRERSRSVKPLIPRVSQLTIEQGPVPQNKPQRVPEEAPVLCAMYKITDKAGDLWAQYEGTEAVLYQVQVQHQARPSVS